jgi:hypothetical protein
MFYVQCIIVWPFETYFYRKIVYCTFRQRTSATQYKFIKIWYCYVRIISQYKQS